jgi:hypothetical protein
MCPKSRNILKSVSPGIIPLWNISWASDEAYGYGTDSEYVWKHTTLVSQFLPLFSFTNYWTGSEHVWKNPTDISQFHSWFSFTNSQTDSEWVWKHPTDVSHFLPSFSYIYSKDHSHLERIEGLFITKNFNWPWQFLNQETLKITYQYYEELVKKIMHITLTVWIVYLHA